MAKILKRILFILLLFSSFLLDAQKIHFKKTETGFWVYEGEAKVMFFQRNMNDSVPEFARNNYFHPVYDLNGKVITEDFPKDHPHQRGIFWGWHKIYVNGEKVADQWELDNFVQTIKNVEFKRGNTNQGYLSYTSIWYANDAIPLKLMQEKTYVTIYPQTQNYRRIDFEINLRALAYNLQLGGSNDKKGYGGFSARIITNENTVFTAKGGRVEPSLHGMELGSFIDITNLELDYGITIIAWPGNPESYHWILRQQNSMQNCAWPGNQLVDIPVKNGLVLRYSLFIHRGNTNVVPIIPTLNDLTTLEKQLNNIVE